MKVGAQVTATCLLVFLCDFVIFQKQKSKQAIAFDLQFICALIIQIQMEIPSLSFTFSLVCMILLLLNALTLPEPLQINVSRNRKNFIEGTITHVYGQPGVA